MKKVIALIMSVIIICIGCTCAFASDKSCSCKNTPFIVVNGMGACAYTNSETGDSVFPPTVDGKALAVEIINGFARTLINLDAKYLTDMIINIANDLLGQMACDAQGKPLYSYVNSPTFEKSVGEYEGIFEENTAAEIQLAQEMGENIGDDHVYIFNYDWRLAPESNADKLDAFIQNVKQKTGHAKVDIAACSMGGIQTMSYLEKYADKGDIESCLFLSAAYTGTIIVSELFCGMVDFNSDAALSFLSVQKTGNSVLDRLTSGACNALKKAYITKVLFGLANSLTNRMEDRAYNEVLKKTFGTMPGMWAMVRSDYYEQAKDTMLDESTSKDFIELIDSYQYNVHQKREEILQDAQDSGVSIAFFSNYDRGCVPVYPSSITHGDNTIETVCTSGGATVADMYDTLGSGYTQKNACNCGKNHVSADNVIDASTCMFPDYTWFFKGMNHVGTYYGSDYNDFVCWFLQFDGQPTVFSDEAHPQFMTADAKQMTLTPAE